MGLAAGASLPAPHTQPWAHEPLLGTWGQSPAWAPSAPTLVLYLHRAPLRAPYAAGQPQQLYQPLDLCLLQQQCLLRAAQPALLRSQARPAQPGAPRGVLCHGQLLPGQRHFLLRSQGAPSFQRLHKAQLPARGWPWDSLGEEGPLGIGSQL